MVVAACAKEDPSSTIVAVVASDLSVPGEIDGVDIVVAGGELRFSFPLGEGAGLHRLPVQAAIAAGGRRDREFEVEAVARKGDSRLLSQTATVSFVPGAAQEVRLFLGRSCLTVPACPADSSCQDGACMPRRQVGARRTLAPGERPGPIVPADAAADGLAPDTRQEDATGPETIAEPKPDAAVETPRTDVAAEAGPADAADVPDVTDSAPGKLAYLVVGDPAAPTAGDSRLRTALEAEGFEVRLLDDGAPASMASGARLVVLTSSCSSSALGSKYRDVATPVLTLDSGVFGLMGLTGPIVAVDHGEEQASQVQIVREAHPLAGGLTGSVAVVTQAAGMNWGRPAAAAEQIATFQGMADKVAIFAYERGAAMIGHTAPARRVGFFAADAAAERLTADGLRLLDAAVSWLSQ